jgi:hypothetical protein
MSPDDELDALVAARTATDPARLNERLRLIWPHARGPLHRHDPNALLELFSHAGYVTDRLPRPVAVTTVYRGPPSGPNRRLGISWTTDRGIACRYAQGYSTVADAACLAARVVTDAFLGTFRFEAEVVVDPERLSSVVTLAKWSRSTKPL